MKPKFVQSLKEHISSYLPIYMTSLIVNGTAIYGGYDLHKQLQELEQEVQDSMNQFQQSVNTMFLQIEYTDSGFKEIYECLRDSDCGFEVVETKLKLIKDNIEGKLKE